jgi:hypothetical protein
MRQSAVTGVTPKIVTGFLLLRRPAMRLGYLMVESSPLTA